MNSAAVLKPSAASQDSHAQWLDALRFVSAMVVVVAHVRGAAFLDFASLDAGSQTTATALFFAITRLGREAVIVFFVLSGFFVGGKAIELLRSGQFNTKFYAVDRISRLWVPLLPVLLISHFGVTPSVQTSIEFVGNLIGLQGILVPVFQGNGPLWSLSYEVWFYTLPVGISLIMTAGKSRLFGVVLIIIACLALTSMSPHLAICWFLGAGAWLIKDRYTQKHYIFLGGALMVTCIAALQLSSEGSSAMFPEYRTTGPVFDILLALGTAFLLAPLTKLKPTKPSHILATMAAFSYTLYLSHYPLLFFLARFFKRSDSIDIASLGVFFGITALCLLYAFALYLVFERHTTWVRRAIKSHL